jgi:diadenosine tetraphosphate (Ap4A) HIT family hydrolase
LLVIPKSHYDRFELTPPEVVGKLYQVVHKLAPAVVRATGAAGFNLGLNSGPAAGQIIFHTHVHIIPRVPHDGLEPWGSKDYQGSEMDEVAKRIRAALKV